ncbi:T9SS type B sorting domain-containing protein [Carboxylicivirga sediminis]|uniref:T9SS type B sorting domain-containing protein n=1 Tax=Carboxylicivirga sediminis TaxID=2006564 RepID=A0A941FA54_9BACT|nr:T9SS type B sorting domain-containing protein [Carboxylicivirga sediminis]MBR8538073.1 T9SS type B sorting domain-containing protein [Carboxylicivirga sediminis]
MQKSLFVFLTLFFLLNNAGAQVGKEFWFVAPDVTYEHGDEPIVFRITALNTDANVTVSMPADGGRVIQNIRVRANTQERIDLDKDVVENHPSDRVNNKGILITSDADITAYYEVANGVNPDKFTLKGHNALGIEFFVPSQNTYRNKPHNQIADEKVDIVATEDNTTVTIIPTEAVVGHAANVPYTITLNRGQTYCIENQNDWSPASSLAGTYISADKKIAVTISDDSVWQGPGFGPYDLIGDQLIPTAIIGTNYIAVNTNPDNRTINKVYVLATQDDTYITLIYQSQRLVKLLNKGEQLDLDIEGNALFIDADKPVYAYQLASLWNRSGNEMGSAVLPSTNCTGSKTVSFVRTFTLEFWVQLLTQQKNLNSFTLKDQDGNVLNDLESVNWIKVEGTDEGAAEDTWYSGIIQLDITTGAPHTIENSNGLFHMSILDENQGSVSYGYFSSFGQLRVEGPTQECQGNQIVLSTTEPMRSYNWFSEHTGDAVLSTSPTLSVSQSGTYWVTAEVNFGGCLQTDSIEVEFLLPEFDLGPDTVVCPDETITFEVPNGLGTYEWFDGSNGHSTSVVLAEGETKEVWLTVTDGFNCSNTDRKQVSTHTLPVIVLNTTTLCQGERIVADDANIERFEWRLNGEVLNVDETQNYIEPSVSGRYTLTVWGAEGCPVTESFDVTVHTLPNFTVGDQLGCIAATTSIAAPLTGAGYSYLWSDNSTSASLDVNVAGDYWLEITDQYGCMSRDEFNFDFLPPAPFDLGPDRQECAGITLTIEQGSDYSNFEWRFQQDGVGAITDLETPTPEWAYEISPASPADNGRYYVTAIDKDGCAVADDVEVAFVDAPDPQLGLSQNLCSGEEITITVTDGYDNYEWYKDNVLQPTLTTAQIQTMSPGVYRVNATIGGCTKTNEVTVTEHAKPTVALADPGSICPNATQVINIDNFVSTDGAFAYLEWNTSPRRYTNWGTAQLVVDGPGTYSVTAYDEYGCAATDAVSVGAFPVTDIGIAPIEETCANEDAVLENPVNTARSYDWYKINTASDAHLIANDAWVTNIAGSYRLVVEDENGCINADTVAVKTLPVPQIELGPAREMCEGDTITLETDPSFTSYRWNGDGNLNMPFLLVTSSNTYQVEVANIYGCMATDDVPVTVNPVPVFTVADATECSGVSGTLSAPAGLTNYRWSNGASTPSITVTKGTYTLRAETPKGCVGTATARVIWHPIPQVSIGADTAICPVDIIPLEATAGFEFYEWHNGDVGRFSYANFSDTVNVVKVRDANDCWGFDTKMVHALPAPDYELCPDTAVCNGDSLLLEAGYDYFDYRWFDDSRLPTYTVKEPGQYWVRVLDGCFWLQDTTTVVFHETPVIATLDTLIYGQIGVLAEGGTAPYVYALNDDDWQEENVFKKLENGTYIVQVQDVNTCMAVDTVVLNSIVDIEVPNFVTPNNDGINDRWEIKGMEKFPDSIIKIYDRFGKLLIEYKASEPGWNGEYLGKPVPSDAYWYVIEVLPLQKMLKGHITLKR